MTLQPQEGAQSAKNQAADYNFEIGIACHQIAYALGQNPDKLVHFLELVANGLSYGELSEHLGNVNDPVETAMFFRNFADLLDPAGA